MSRLYADPDEVFTNRGEGPGSMEGGGATMGVSVESAGGRGRKVDFEMNLVPFIDLLSVMITFLLATAVMTQIAGLPLEQVVSDSTVAPPDGPPTLRVSVEGAVVRVTRGEATTDVPYVEGAPDWAVVDGLLDADRAAYPDEDGVVIAGQDGVRYEHVLRALDLTRGKGYERALIGSSGP